MLSRINDAEQRARDAEARARQAVAGVSKPFDLGPRHPCRSCPSPTRPRSSSSPRARRARRRRRRSVGGADAGGRGRVAPAVEEPAAVEPEPASGEPEEVVIRTADLPGARHPDRVARRPPRRAPRRPRLRERGRVGANRQPGGCPGSGDAARSQFPDRFTRGYARRAPCRPRLRERGRLGADRGSPEMFRPPSSLRPPERTGGADVHRADQPEHGELRGTPRGGPLGHPDRARRPPRARRRLLLGRRAGRDPRFPRTSSIRSSRS